MGMKVNTLLGYRLFHNNKGETLLLQKGIDPYRGTVTSLHKLDGVYVTLVSEKIYRSNHSAKSPHILKSHHIKEQSVIRQKKGNNIIDTLYSYQVGNNCRLEFRETKNGVEYKSVFKDRLIMPISLIKYFCEMFGAPGKRIFNKFEKNNFKFYNE